jgi:hypothetical protein
MNLAKTWQQADESGAKKGKEKGCEREAMNLAEDIAAEPWLFGSGDSFRG